MKLKDELIMKYGAYMNAGHSVFAVTLSTFVEKERVARSDAMRRFWDFHFIYRVLDQLPYKLKRRVDHDYVVECAPASVFHRAVGAVPQERGDPKGFFHYHGFLAMSAECSERIWKNGALHPRLDRALRSFEHRGENRPFCVNKYLIEPIDNLKGGVTAWTKYIVKSPFMSSAA